MSFLPRRFTLALPLALLPLAVPRALRAQELAPSRFFKFEKLKETVGSTTKIRQMMTGLTHQGFRIDLHETELAPGKMPHPEHHHVHEEMLLIRDGTLAVTVGDQTDTLGAGSAVYIASNSPHHWQNIGTTPAHYFVLALGTDAPAEKAADGLAPERHP